MYAVVVDLATSLEKPSGKMDHHPGERIPVQDGQLVLTQAEPKKS